MFALCGLYTEIAQVLKMKIYVLTTGSLDENFLRSISKTRCCSTNNDRNVDILRHIISYCEEIASTIERFGNDYTTFRHDSVYKNATALCVLQIGELTTHLTDSFK